MDGQPRRPQGLRALHPQFFGGLEWPPVLNVYIVNLLTVALLWGSLCIVLWPVVIRMSQLNPVQFSFVLLYLFIWVLGSLYALQFLIHSTFHTCLVV